MCTLGRVLQHAYGAENCGCDAPDATFAWPHHISTITLLRHITSLFQCNHPTPA